MSEKEQKQEKITIEEWIHRNIDQSWEACDHCAWSLECGMRWELTSDSLKCPFRDFKIIPKEKKEEEGESS